MDVVAELSRLGSLIRQLQGAAQGERRVRGTVSSTGSILLPAAPAFSVNKTGTGTYVVTFTTGFAAAPTVVVGAGSTGGDRAAKVSVFPTTTGFTGFTFATGAGTAQDNEWHFIAVGP